MGVLKLLPAVLLLLAACVFAEKYDNETVKETEPKPKKPNSLLTKLISRPAEYDVELDELTPEEKEEKLKILTMEGKPGWLTIVKKAGKAIEKRLKKEIEKKNKEKGRDHSKLVHQLDSSSATELINTVKGKLTGFTSPLATKVKTKMTDLNTKWNTLEETDRKSIMGTLTVISTNIEKFGDAGSNPIGAVQGAINIVGAISTFFGPTGQLVSIGLSFVSALLGLFGKGPKPKPLAEVVREQIDEALNEFRYETLIDKAGGLVNAFRGSASYLDGVLRSDDPIDKDQVQLAASRVPMTQGDLFMGELSMVILKMFKEGKAGEAQKCLRYCELYAQLAGLKDMIITQLITMSTDVMDSDALGLLSYQENFREATKILLEPLYKTNYGSKMLPYFDPDISVATDSYAVAVLKIGAYDRSRAGMYCLMTQGRGGLEDLIWSAQYDYFHVNGKPYTTITTQSNDNCYWKLVPHGNSLYSIVNKKGCENNAKWCGSLLSFDIIDGTGYVNVEPTDGVMWEIHGSQWNRIRNKWSCGGSKQTGWCNRELRISTRTKHFISFMMPPQSHTERVGKVLPSDGKYYWVLRRKA